MMTEVHDGPLGRSISATEVIEPGQLIFESWGYEVPRRTRHSLQVDHDKHIVIHTEIELINHSCDPNCGVLVRRGDDSLEIRALRRIEPGEELRTDYATFEYEIQFMPGPCLCGSPICRGRITGYKDLPEHRREDYGPYLAEYLQEIDAAVTAPVS